MAISWGVRKQLSYLSVVILIFGAAAGFFVWKYYTGGTCFDKRQNQKETGVDCGDPCVPCPIGLKEPLALWVRFFPIQGNTYDAAALIENPNFNWSSKQIIYSFKLYDKDNILIVEREGLTFLNAKERALLFESGLRTEQRKPTRAVLEIEPVNNWKYTERVPPYFIITKKKFDPMLSLLEVEIQNDASSVFKNIYLVAALFDKENNAFAASGTKIDWMSAGAIEKANFTWREKFQEQPSRIEIFTRTDMAE